MKTTSFEMAFIIRDFMEETSMIRVLKIEPGRPPEEVKMANTLEDLQEAVGGLIEVVTLDSDVCLICNDEGKLIGLPGNRRLRGDIIAGTFVIGRLVKCIV